MTLEVIREDEGMDVTRAPYLKIVEQPASKALRFRYECEGRSAGTIPGIHSTPENRTYPTVQIMNYEGPAVVVVSCVTKESPHKPHPHNLVGREDCRDGICSVEVDIKTMTRSFDHLGIQCVKKKDVESALTVRQNRRVDPFGTGFKHAMQPGSIDLNAVRLSFQAFLPNGKNKWIPLEPVVSNIIYDKKAVYELSICMLSHTSASVIGGLKMILLCDKVSKDDIQVWLYEEKDGNIVWEAQADFNPAQVHKQVAISFTTPKYKTVEVDKAVDVNIQLRRPSDKERSEPVPFKLTPLEPGRPSLWSVRRYKADYRSFSNILSADSKRLAKASTAQDTNKNSDCVDLDSNSTNNKHLEPTICQESTIQIVDSPRDNDKAKLGNYSVTVNIDHHRKLEDVIKLVNKRVERSLDDLIDEVDSFEDMMNTSMDDEVIAVDNNGVYSSFQMAMRNPFNLTEYNTSGYEDIVPPRPCAAKPTVVQEGFTDPLPSSEVLPPLPPKRVRKSPPNKTLPPVPESKKLNLFQKIFSSKRKEKSRKNSVSSISSRKSITDDSTLTEELAEAETDELAEVEHYALYTAFAPHATASEFDETSFYYSPVEGQTLK